MDKRIKYFALGVSAGYLFSEYMIVRRTAKIIRENTRTPESIQEAWLAWAKGKVMKEVERGKYADAKTFEELERRVNADFDYYKQIASALNVR